ncbi:MAG: hypothetical protein J3K34DRAFT_525600 [Monoraphidium minutum]|nr:MAG: hypothetical protein J3K34DRAFT_525600 [Monoraphidium minutum]
MLSKEELLRFVTPDETAAEFLGRQVSEAVPTGVLCIDQHVQLRPGQVLEIVGPTGTAKSELLAQIAAHFVTSCQGDDPAAVPGHVVLIDLDCKFDPLRLIRLLSARVQSQQALDAALARFHLARARSSAQLLALLATLPQRLQQMQARARPCCLVKCSLLLIDNIGSYSWQDRAARPPPAPPPAPPGAAPTPAPAGPPLTLQRVHAAATDLLRVLSLRLRLAVVATKSAAVGWQDGGGEGERRMTQREYLPPSWQVDFEPRRVVTHRLLLQQGRPPVVPGSQEPLTHVIAQLQSELGGRREAPTDFFVGTGGITSRPT